MAVVTNEELRTYMGGISLSPTQLQTLTYIIEGVQQELEMYINRAIEPTQIRELVATDATGVAYLSQSPISAILKISNFSRSSPLNVRELGVIEMGDLTPFEGAQHDYIPEGDGIDLIVPGGINLGITSGDGARFVVEYIGGGGAFIARYLKGIKLAVMRVAAREAQHMVDGAMTIKNVSATEPMDPNGNIPKGWQPWELERFDRIRRRVVS